MNRLHFLIALLILLAGVVRLTEPLHDGDLFWHLGYARWMWQHGTLIPDHTVFSWMPTENNSVYCAWLGQFSLLAVQASLGLNGLFALRYLAVLGLVVIHYKVARARYGCPPILASGLVFLWLLASYSGTAIKPELFSFVLWNGLVLLWADQLCKAHSRRSLALAPWLMLIWANTHGAFYFGLLLLTCCWVSSRLDKLSAAGGPSWRWLVACWGATLLTPYGWNYLLQQVTMRLQNEANKLAVAASRHWEPIYAANNQPLHLFEYWLGMLLILGLLVGYLRGKSINWQLVVPNLAFAALALMHIRTNYLWAPLWLYTILILLRNFTWSRVSTRKLNALLLLLITFLVVRTCWECYARPYRGQFFGLGLGYQNPQREVEFLKTQAPLGRRLYNSYDHGGYILWELGPKTQVMMDSRAFPYRIWFAEYLAFAQGQNFSEFTTKYPAELALISWRDRECLRQFIRHPSWHCIFTGPAGAIFSKTSLITASDPNRFQDVFSSDQLLQVFAGLLDLGDLRSAEDLVAGAKERILLGRDQRVVRALSQHLQGLRQVESKDYAGALNTLEEAARGGFYINHTLLDALREWKKHR